MTLGGTAGSPDTHASRSRIVGAVGVAIVVAVAAGCGGSTKSPVVVGTQSETLASENVHKVPQWATTNRLPATALPGARLFASIGCLNCHFYLGTGGGYNGAPDLSKEGLKDRGRSWQIRHLRCPSCVVPGSPMPSFRALGRRRLTQLAIFLEASRGGK